MCYIRVTAQGDVSLSACLRPSVSYSISRRANNVDIDFQNGPAPPDFKMYTPFNPFCLSGIAGLIKIGWRPLPFCNRRLHQRVCSDAVDMCVVFQGAASNVIRCRKDGNWTGSFQLCPHIKGQCSLPQNLHYSLQYSCHRGHGIGVYARTEPGRYRPSVSVFFFFVDNLTPFLFFPPSPVPSPNGT